MLTYFSLGSGLDFVGVGALVGPSRPRDDKIGGGFLNQRKIYVSARPQAAAISSWVARSSVIKDSISDWYFAIMVSSP